MRVEIHELFKSFLNALEAKPRYSIVNSLAAPPKLGDFLDDLNPDLSLDWSGESFQGLPSLREKVVERMQLFPDMGSLSILDAARFLSIKNKKMNELIEREVIPVTNHYSSRQIEYKELVNWIYAKCPGGELEPEPGN